MPPKPRIYVAIPLPQSFLLPRSCLKPTHSTSQRIQTRSFGIKATSRPYFTKYNEPYNLLAAPKAAYERKIQADTLPLRTGALAIKRGMTAIYDTTTGVRIPCTVLQLDRNQVVHHKTLDKHGYYAVCIGAGARQPKNVSKPMLGHFSAQGVAPKMQLQEFRVRDEKGLLAVGESLKPSWFMVGQYIDARADSKGKGFAGVMKKWGFGGQPRSHGHSLSHRSLGSTGNGQGGGSRVYPGKKMAGRMGGERNTVQNLKVLQVDDENGLVVVKGAVSGNKGAYVMIQDALKKPWPNVPPPPTPAEVDSKLKEAVGAKNEQ